MRARLEALITGPPPSPADLTAAALDLCAWQREHIPAYGRFAADATPRSLEDIPAVPVSLLRDIPIRHRGAFEVFRTSGTTSSRRGEHWLVDTHLYDLAARRWFDTCVPDCPVGQTHALVPDPAQAQDSSLGHMVRCLAPDSTWHFDKRRGVLPTAWPALADAEGPVFLAATAFALADLLEREGTAALAEGSVVMVTGGFKGRQTTLDEATLRSQATARLGGRVRWVGEYGMTELSSQCWDTGAGFQAPPWLHVWTADPATGLPAPEGLLCFVDLANWSSPLALETEDMGRVDGRTITLLGRLPQAAPRGCSLTAEEARWRR